MLSMMTGISYVDERKWRTRRIYSKFTFAYYLDPDAVAARFTARKSLFKSKWISPSIGLITEVGNLRDDRSCAWF
jgi:hypothetical protein